MMSQIITLGFCIIASIASILIIIFLSDDKKGAERDRKWARRFAWLIIVAEVVAAIATAVFKDNNLYKVLEVYDEGVAVRRLTDDEHNTTVIPMSKEAAKLLKECDLVNKDGDIVIDGVWLGAEPTVADETLTDVD